MNWLQLKIADDDESASDNDDDEDDGQKGGDSFAMALLKYGGISKETILEWSKDPQIILNDDGERGSIFDALEDMDVLECYHKLVQLNEINK